MEVRWLTEPYVTAVKSHAYSSGSVRSLCGLRQLPIRFVEDSDVPRCGNCQRMVVQRMTTEHIPTEPHWLDAAVQAVLGDSWTYAEVSGMPSYRAEVERVAAALADAFKQGMLQANTAA